MTRRQPFPLLPCLLLAAVWLLAPIPALAQECGSWREPVLCSGELQARDENGRWDRFDPRDTLEITPGGQRELELTGRDQTGRTFPAYRLALDADTRDCDRLLEVEDLGEGRLRIRASRSEGMCRLDVWLPGNLNFAWRIEVEVARAPRTSYERGEAELIARGLYQALLGREGDPGGLSAATAEIQRGNLEAQIRSMIGSEEFRTKQMAMSSEQLLAQFFRGLLGREPDSAGVRTFTQDMQFRRYTDVLLGIIHSVEFEERLARER